MQIQPRLVLKLVQVHLQGATDKGREGQCCVSRQGSPPSMLTSPRSSGFEDIPSFKPRSSEQCGLNPRLGVSNSSSKLIRESE